MDHGMQLCAHIFVSSLYQEDFSFAHVQSSQVCSWAMWRGKTSLLSWRGSLVFVFPFCEISLTWKRGTSANKPIFERRLKIRFVHLDLIASCRSWQAWREFGLLHSENQTSGMLHPRFFSMTSHQWTAIQSYLSPLKKTLEFVSRVGTPSSPWIWKPLSSSASLHQESPITALLFRPLVLIFTN